MSPVGFIVACDIREFAFRGSVFSSTGLNFLEISIENPHPSGSWLSQPKSAAKLWWALVEQGNLRARTLVHP